MEVVILCGGKGTRLSEETISKPKPMVEIGGIPILYHIMRYYSYFGFKKFVLALGYKADYIKNYFYNLRYTSSDFTISLNQSNPLKFHNLPFDSDWEISLIDTGLNSLKGSRIKRIEKYINSDNFLLTYGDGLSNVNINELIKFHLKNKKLATLTAVKPPSRFGEILIKNNLVSEFQEKSQMHTGYINGGFFVLNKKIMDYLSESENCDFEFGPLQLLSKENQLAAFKHNDFWQCMDNVRERDYLENLFNSKKAPWIL
tara:strand:+ start:54 stop:827 length:774 start_codon:yes stop_codon:yes gene_type:complete